MRADADGIIRSEPVETPTNGTEMRCGAPVETRSVAVVEEDEWAGWNNWARGHVDILRQEMLDSVSEAFALVRAEWEDAFDAQSKRIKELELKLAEAMGAINTLRGKGAPGSLNVPRQEMLDSVGDALGMVRRDIEDQIAAQAKRITELELKLAEAVGALNVLHGKGRRAVSTCEARSTPIRFTVTSI